MRKRSVVILNKYLEKSQRSFSIPLLAKEFDVSIKTIRNDIKEINELLNSHQIPEISIDENNHILYNEKVKASKIQEALEQLDFYSYRLSSEERVMYIVTTLLYHNETYTTMQNLADSLGVTRITIMNDFDLVKQQLKEYKITIVSSSKKGVSIKGSYYDRLRLLVNLFQAFGLMKDTPCFFQSEIHSVLHATYEYDTIFQKIDETNQKYNVVFFGEAMSRIVMLLYVLLNYPCPKQKTTIKKTGLDFILKEVCESFSISLDSIQMKYYQKYLKEFHIFELMKSTNYIELYEIVRYFLSEIGKEITYHLEDDELLIESLVLHIKNVRDISDIVFSLKDDSHLPINVEVIESATKNHIPILENFLNYRLDDNVISSIILHIGASMVRKFAQSKKLRVLIVCATSMATGKYLEAQVKNYFDFDIVSVSSAYSLNQNMIQEMKVDFIISSIPLKIEDVPIVLMNAKLTMEDLNNIQAMVFKLEKTVIQIINHKKALMKRAEYLFDEIKNEEQLEQFAHELELLIDRFEEKFLVNGKVHLHHMLKPKYIQITKESICWQDAIRLAGKPLLDHGYINENYIEKNIKNVYEFGDYIVISPRIALAHASSSDGVHKDGVSLLVSKQSISFYEETSVNLVFCFASTGEKDYTNLLKEIISIGKNKNSLETILSLHNSIDIYYKLIK